MKNGPTPASVLAWAFALTAPAWLPVSGTSRLVTCRARPVAAPSAQSATVSTQLRF
jgi:hypothetical protein